MRRIGKRVIAITMAAAMMTSLTPQETAFLQQEVVYAAEQGTTVDASQKFAFDVTQSWNGEQTLDAVNASTDEVPAVGTTITTDLLIPTEGKSAADFKGEIKSQAVIYPGGDYVAVRDWPAVTAESFKDKVTVDGKEYFKASVTYTIGDKVGANVADVWTEEVDFNQAVKKPLTKVSIKIAGEKTDYSGTIAIANTKVNMPSKAVTIDSSDTYKFDKKSTWDEQAGREKAVEQSVNYVTESVPAAGSTLSVDVLLPAVEGKDKPDFAGVIKTQGILRLGKDWTWVQSKDIPELKAEDFSEKVKDAEGNEFYKATVSYTFGNKVGANNPEWTEDAPFEDVVKEPVAGVSVKFAGYNCDYSGKIAISGAKIQMAEAPLEAQDPTVLSDLKDSTDFKKWNEEGGWDYYHGGTENTSPKIAYDEAGQRLKVSLDYSANKTSTWSEAKVKCTVPTPVSVKNYNQVSVDLIYKGDNPVSKIKFYAKDKETDSKEIINVYGNVDTAAAEELGNGYRKVTVTMDFQSAQSSVDNVTIGLIGYETAFKGDVYLDNLTLSQFDNSSDFVEITSKADNQKAKETAAKTEGMETSVTLADKDATASTLALYSYLKNLDSKDQVLFGHQNDNFKSVNGNAADGSDTKDLTGSLSGIMGIDSLALTGAELDSVDKAVEKSKAAAEQGAILSLSSHMPNMSNSKVVKTKDGYDFSACNFEECKDLSNMKGSAAKEVLPGGKYNAAFNAYLDIIAEYAKGLGDTPVLFRPFHEGDGSWFWWGAADNETYKAIFRYTEDYLQENGVHNFIYVYSPCGPAKADTYEDRYPGDDYVDVLGFDAYDDYGSATAAYSDTYFTNMKAGCEVIRKLADEKGKVAAIAEAGVRVTKPDGSDSEGLLVKGNPIKGQNWYSKLNEVAKETGMSYFLVWANFSDTNFYIPYKYNETKGQELVNEFIDFYNEDSSIFADGTNFYGSASKTEVKNDNQGQTPKGYITSIASKDTIKKAVTLKANVKNAKDVKFVLKNGKVTKEIAAVKSADSDVYSAKVTTAILTALGKTDNGTIKLMADGKTLATLNYISFGKDKDVLPANVIDNFELYYGDNSYLASSFGSNEAAGCSSTIKLDKANAKSGSYAGAFTYTLKGDGAYTGKIKYQDYNLSKYNALLMWVKPDGKGQKLIIQVGDKSGEEFEVNLTNFVKGTKAQYVTIPFTSFVGKQGGKLNPAGITKFAIYCNRIDKDLTSTIYFDDIQAVNLTKAELAKKDKNGLIISSKAVGTTKTTVTKSKTLKNVAKSTNAKVTITTDFTGAKSAKATITKKCKKSEAGVLSSTVVAKVVKSAGTKNVTITQKAVDSKGKTICTLVVNAKSLKAGAKLSVYKKNAKTGAYTKVKGKTVKVSKKGGISYKVSSGTYKFK